MKKILITGGNGYIARSLYKALHHKYEITTINRSTFDLTNYARTCEFLQDKYFDVVIHTAIIGGNRLIEEDDSIIKQNLDMYYNLVNNQQHFGKFISFGSGAELDWPTTPYGYSKRIIAESMSKRDNCLNLRIFAVFDENEKDRRFIKSNIKRYLSREDILVHEDKFMDFFYMQDLIALVDYHLCRQDWLFSEIDCKYTDCYKLSEVASMINKLDNYKVDVCVAQTEGKPYVGNYIGLPIPLIGLEKGIMDVYSILKANT
jgi:dTDP-4-dehydrorhamnose reductase